jgi:hypothetical protein
MVKSPKRLVFIGAAVMVMTSFAAPAMADDSNSLATPTDYGSVFGPDDGIVVGPAPKQNTPAPHVIYERPPCFHLTSWGSCVHQQPGKHYL